MPEQPTLTVDFIISLDGYASAEGWPGYWGIEAPEYLKWLDSAAEKGHTTLMGATTYRLMSGFAEEYPDEPAFQMLADMPKIVFSSTLQEPLSWSNSRLVAGDAVEAVREMKQDGGASLRTLGSVSLCRSLISAGLVDRLRVVVFPVVTGKTGRERIYDGYPDLMLELVESRTFDNKLQLLEYVPRIITEPPPGGVAGP